MGSVGKALQDAVAGELMRLSIKARNATTLKRVELLNLMTRASMAFQDSFKSKMPSYPSAHLEDSFNTVIAACATTAVAVRAAGAKQAKAKAKVRAKLAPAKQAVKRRR